MLHDLLFMGFSVFSLTFSTFYSHYKVSDSSLEIDDFFNYLLCWVLWGVSYILIIVVFSLVVLSMAESINNEELCVDIGRNVAGFCQKGFEYVCYTAFDFDTSDGMFSDDNFDIDSLSSTDRPQKIQSYLDSNTSHFQN